MSRQTRIDLRGISVFAHHGVFAQERSEGQRFIVDLRCGITHPAVDDLPATVDYASLARRVHDLVADDPVDLIEIVADRVARACLEDARVEWVEVTVHKPDVEMPVPVADVSVTVAMTRGSDD